MYNYAYGYVESYRKTLTKTQIKELLTRTVFGSC